MSRDSKPHNISPRDPNESDTEIEDEELGPNLTITSPPGSTLPTAWSPPRASDTQTSLPALPPLTQPLTQHISNSAPALSHATTQSYPNIFSKQRRKKNQRADETPSTAPTSQPYAPTSTSSSSTSSSNFPSPTPESHSNHSAPTTPSIITAARQEMHSTRTSSTSTSPASSASFTPKTPTPDHTSPSKQRRQTHAQMVANLKKEMPSLNLNDTNSSRVSSSTASVINTETLSRSSRIFSGNSSDSPHTPSPSTNLFLQTKTPRSRSEKSSRISAWEFPPQH